MKTPIAVPLLLALALSLASCANPSDTGPAPAPAPDSAPSAATAGFPAVVPTKFGDITVQTKPERVVALGWGDAETALALGVQPVGASDWLQFGGEGVGPWAAGRYDTPPKIIGTLEPSYEAIAALQPDLILDTKSSGDQARYDKLSAIATTVGVPTGGANYLTTTEQQMTMIAEALGGKEQARSLLAKMEASFAEVRKAHPQWQGKTVTAATKTSEGWGAYVAGSERVTFLENLGFRQNPQIAALPANVTGLTVSISTEQLELFDADLIVASPILLDTKAITGDTLFRRIPAVVAGRSIVIDGDPASACSIGTVLATDYAIQKIVPLIAKASG